MSNRKEGGGGGGCFETMNKYIDNRKNAAAPGEDRTDIPLTV